MMRALVVVAALAVGAALGWYARGSFPPEGAGGTAAAVGGVDGSPAQPAGPAADPAAAPAAGATAPAPPTAKAAPAQQVPTAADSAAALAEDVSPEWKMRTRQMEPFAGCMEKTRSAPPEIRPTLVAACHRLPDAPKAR